MTTDIEVTLIVENAEDGQFAGGGVLLRFPPRQGDYIAHETGDGDEARLYRVIAVVIPSNPVSELQTFDVHVVDEGPHNEAMARVMAQQSAVLTRTERLILRNQARILAHLDEAEAPHHSETCEVLERGYERFYDNYLGHLDNTPFDSDVVRFVFEVLNMYRALHSYSTRTGDALLKSTPFAEFAGFYGNEEAEYLEFATFVIENQKQFLELHPAWNRMGGNSHHPTLRVYRRMLAAWKALPNRNELDTESAKAICSAARW